MSLGDRFEAGRNAGSRLSQLVVFLMAALGGGWLWFCTQPARLSGADARLKLQVFARLTADFLQVGDWFPSWILLSLDGYRIPDSWMLEWKILLAIPVAALVLGLAGYLKFGRKEKTEEVLRGATQVSKKELSKIVQRREIADVIQRHGVLAVIQQPKLISRLLGRWPGFTVDRVRLPIWAEQQGTLIAGTSGSGKTVLFTDLMLQARARGKSKGIVIDSGRDFMQRIGQEGDWLINPLDERSAQISIFGDIRDIETDSTRIAHAFLPLPAFGEKVWVEQAQILLSDLIQGLWEAGRTTNGDLFWAMSQSNLQQKIKLIKGKSSEQNLKGENEKGRDSILMMLTKVSSALSTLNPDVGPNDGFSIRRWAESRTNGWLFLSFGADQRPTLGPIYSYLIDTVITTLNSGATDGQNAIYFWLDEFATLPKIRSLPSLFAEGRKFGSRNFVGVQNVSQVFAAYGEKEGNAILGNLSTSIILRSNDPQTAKMMSSWLGESEVLRQNKSTARGNKDSYSEHTAVTPLVLPAEIQRLPNLQGYLKLPGDFPVTKIKLKPKNLPLLCEPFIPKSKKTQTSHGRSLNDADRVDEDQPVHPEFDPDERDFQ